MAVDFGLKRNILRCLVDAGRRVHPCSPSRVSLPGRPDPPAQARLRVFLSNGPGYRGRLLTPSTPLCLLGKPLFGICLGDRSLLALALGATTYKLKFGLISRPHQLTIHVTTNRVDMDHENHGFAVRPAQPRRQGRRPPTCT